MDFSPYQQKERFSNPNVNYTDPLRVHADHSGGLALAKQDAKNVGVFINGVLAYKEKVDSAKSMEANNEYNRLMSEGTAELMQRKQEKALNIVDEYDKLQAKVLERVQKQYKSYIGYGDAAVAFNNYTTKDNATRRANMLKYQLAETDAYHETQFNNSMATCEQMVLDGGGTNEAIDGATARMETLVDSRYFNYGNAKKDEQKRILKNQLVSSALSLAVKMEDYVRMGEIVEGYRKSIDPKTYAAVKGMLWKREKESTELSDGQRMMRQLGPNPTEAQIREYAKNNYYKRYPSESGVNYTGSNAEVWAAAKHVEARTGGKLKAEWVYRQWYHETFYDGEPFNSPLVHENKNFGGLTQVEPNGEDNRQPEEGATNYYREFNSLQEYADAYVDDFINYYEGIDDVHDLASFARFLKYNGYYGGDDETQYEDEIANYLAGMERAEMDVDDSTPKAQAGAQTREPSGVEFEKYVDSLRAFAKKQEGIVRSDENYWIEQGSLQQQDLINQGVEDPDAFDAIALQCWEASGHSERVRIALEKQGGHLRNILRKAAEREAARASGTGGRASSDGGSGGRSGRKNTDPFFLSNLELLLRNGCSREQAFAIIDEENPSDGKSAIKLVNDYFAGKEKYSVDWDGDYKQKLADYCDVKKSDGDFNILFGQATNYAYELMMQYRDEHGGKDPTSQQILEYLIDGVTKTRIDTGERSWFGFGEPIYEESPLTPAEWLNRGVYNDPAEHYDSERGVYTVQTRKGTYYATEEQYERIVAGEDADIVLAEQQEE